jgi:adenylosuccinate synthase
MRNKAVIGLGFGDEGKGLVTDYLCLQHPEAIVVRYSGGQQASHTVVTDKIRHSFSNFGSGTLRGNDTYWSKYCTFDPVSTYTEYLSLLSKGIIDREYPMLLIHPKTPVTTPMDKHFNQINDFKNGTCGMGVGSTLKREKDYYSLVFEDLYYDSILRIKLDAIFKYYKYNIDDFKEEMDVFMYTVKKLDSLNVTQSSYIKDGNATMIFEGSQGLMLDKKIGFFPHVTSTRTGSTNIRKISKDVEYYCVTRAYQTRHGNGPMLHEDVKHNIIRNPLEHNISNKFQGDFRISVLDVSLLEYALSKDPKISRDNLVITCMDHLPGEYYFGFHGRITRADGPRKFVETIKSILGFERVFASNGDRAENIIEV